MKLPSILHKKKRPLILPPGKHTLTKRMIDDEVIDILYRLRRNGYRACLVGGCVRDILLGIKPKDFDIVTDARPNQIKRLFRRCFLIGRRFRLAHVYISHDRFVEVSTFRALVDPAKDEQAGDRFAANNVFGTIDEDVLRRDFTVNALYYDPADSSIVDYTGGLKDMKKKVLRSIGDPMKRFHEDPVRMIRAARFSAMLGFPLSSRDRKAVAANTNLIRETNASRMLEELYKILKCGASAGAVANLDAFGVMPNWIPELGRENLGPLLTRLGVVDRYRLDGDDLPNAVLLTALFFDLFDSEAGITAGTGGFQDAFTAIDTRFREMAVRLRLPRMEWDRVRHAAARLLTLTKITRGKKRRLAHNRFVQSSYFDDAMLFFMIQARATGRYAEEVDYWKRLSRSEGKN